MREIAIKNIIAFLLLAARVASAQGTTTFLSNISQTSAGSQAVGSDSWLAAGFVTGTDASGYLLDSIQLGLASSTGSPSDFTVMLYANEGPGGFSIGNSIGTFIGSLDPSASGTYTYNAPANLVLLPTWIYYVIVNSDTPVATGAYQWNYTSASSYDPMGGFSSLGSGISANGTSWGAFSGFFQYSLIGSVAPEPGVVGLLAVGGLVLLGAKVRGLKSKVRG